MNLSVFEKGSQVFDKILFPFSIQSSYINLFVKQPDSVLKLGDEIIVYSKRFPEGINLQPFYLSLESVVEQLKDDPDAGHSLYPELIQDVENLLKKTKWWLNAIYSLIHFGSTFNPGKKLGIVIQGLNILDPGFHQTDPFKKLIQNTLNIRKKLVEDRNRVKQAWKKDMLPGTLALIIAPLYVHHDQLRQIISSRRTDLPSPQPETNPTVRQQDVLSKGWLDHDLPPEPKKILKELQLLLAVCKPCCTVPFEMMQSFLESKGIEVSKPDLVEYLECVRYQLKGLEYNKISLTSEEFAYQIRNKVYSEVDLKRFHQHFLQWISSADLHEYDTLMETITLFLAYWTNERGDSQEKYASVARQTIEELYRQGKKELLYTFIKCCNGKKGLLQEFRSRCITKLEEEGDPIDHLEKKEVALKQGISKTIEKLMKKAEANDLLALYYLGTMYVYGKEVEENFALGESYLWRAAEGGHIQAALELIKLYLDDDRRKDVNKGKTLLLTYAEKGHVLMKYELAKRLLSGKGLPYGREEGMSWLKQAADDGHLPAMFDLGNMYLEGIHVERNQNLGLQWLKKAAHGGYPRAKSTLKKIHLESED